MVGTTGEVGTGRHRERQVLAGQHQTHLPAGDGEQPKGNQERYRCGEARPPAPRALHKRVRRRRRVLLKSLVTR